MEVALQWCSDAFSDTLLGFVNSIKTIDGGTHMDGFKAALTRTVNALGRKTKALKEGDPNLSGDHIREGLGAIVSVKVNCLAAVAPAGVTDSSPDNCDLALQETKLSAVVWGNACLIVYISTTPGV